MSKVPPLRDELRALIGSCFRIPDQRPIEDWAKENVYLPPSATETPGFYDPQRTPYAGIVTDWFQNDYENNELWVMKSSRTGFTEAALNCVRWMPSNRPGRVLYAIENDNKAKDVITKRLAPTLLKCAVDQVTGNPDDFKKIRLDLRNMIIEACGTGSPAPFTEKQLLFGILDEIEHHPLNKKESAFGTTDQLMRSRFPTSPGWKMIVISNPTLKDGLMHKGFLAGTREVCLVPCYHCGFHQELKPEHLRFSHCKGLDNKWNKARVIRETFYQCQNPDCGKGMSWARHLQEILQDYRWEATNPNPDPGRRSCHISDLYSPYDACSWGMLALKIIASKNDQSKRKILYNIHWGLPWTPGTQTRDEKDILRLRAGSDHPETGETMGEPFLIGRDPSKRTLPFDPALLAIAIDVQHSCTKHAVGAFTPSGELSLVDYGDYGEDEDLRTEVLDKDWCIAGRNHKSHTRRIHMGWRDAGDQKLQQIDWCLKYFSQYKIWPSRGDGPGRGSPVYLKNEEFKGRRYQIYYYRDEALKDWLYLDKISKLARPRLWLPTDIDEHTSFIYELTTERRGLVTTNGYPQWKWKDPTGPNDYGDAMKMLYGIWFIVGDKVRKAHDKKKAREKSDP